MVDGKSLRQLESLREVFTRDFTRVEAEEIIEKVQGEGCGGFIDVAIRNLMGVFELPLNSSLAEYRLTRKEKYSALTAEEVRQSILRSLEVSNVSDESFYDFKRVGLMLDGVVIPVEKICGRSMDVTLFRSLARPYQFFAVFIEGGHGMYEVVKKIDIDAFIVESMESDRLLDWIKGRFA